MEGPPVGERDQLNPPPPPSPMCLHMLQHLVPVLMQQPRINIYTVADKCHLSLSTWHRQTEALHAASHTHAHPFAQQVSLNSHFPVQQSAESTSKIADIPGFRVCAICSRHMPLSVFTAGAAAI